ncbi:Pathogen-specific membrane antigen [Oligella urethralis]|nr:Pathogen-specific membrane antigen [Oligella urethralis]
MRIILNINKEELDMKLIGNALLASATALLFASAANAQEYPVGEPVLKDGMEIVGVYLQPITMDNEGVEPEHQHRPAKDSDIHLEADIHALDGNPNGFAEGDWIPNLNITYNIKKVDGGSNFNHDGHFMMMVASDGPHYGDNVKLDGHGKYKVTFNISPPNPNQMGRHIDKETGVGPWFRPFDVSWEFDYSGTGRKGSY